MPLADLVNVSIEVTGATVAQQGFSIPLVIGHHTVHPETRVRTYSFAGWSAALLLDGFPEDGQIYRCVEAMAKQKRKPLYFKVGRLTTAETQIVRITPTVIGGAGVHSVTVESPDGTAETATYTEDGTATVAEICTGLATAINALTAAVTATGASGTYVQVTADTADQIFGYYGLVAADSLTDESTSTGIGTDLTAILDEDDDWYGVCLPSAAPTAIEAVADWVESHERIFWGYTHDSRPLTASTTDIVSSIENQGYVRSHVSYNSKATRYFGPGLMAKMATYAPGQATWMFKTVEGAEPDKLTADQWNHLKGKNGSYYDRVKGVSMSGEGKTGGGQYLDITQIVDWTRARVSEGFVGMLTGSPKVGYTDQEAGNQSFGVLTNVVTEGQNNNAIDRDPETWSIYVPLIKDIPAIDRQNRRLTGLQLNFRATGAVHSVDVAVGITAF